MDARETRIYDEAAALWRELYGEQPPVRDGSLLLDIITQKLATSEYDQLRSPYLRPSTITGPRRREMNAG
jgi:cytochrome c-type biogenesis protein CcmH/NrfG